MAEKILLVDDEKEFVEALSKRMQTRGIDVAYSTSPKEALKKISKENYDAVVIDLVMPEMDGLTMLAKLKEKKPDIQVILLTGHSSVETGVAAMKLGAMDYLEKPIDIQVLSEKIKNAKAKKMILVEKNMEEKIKSIIETKSW